MACESQSPPWITDYWLFFPIFIWSTRPHLKEKGNFFRENTLLVWFPTNIDHTMLTRLGFYFCRDVYFIKSPKPKSLPSAVPTVVHLKYTHKHTRDCLLLLMWMQTRRSRTTDRRCHILQWGPFPGNRRNLSPFSSSLLFPSEIAFQ